MNKSQLQSLNPQSAAFVVAHARWQASRGRKPSVAYREYRNPELALAAAKRDLAIQDKEFSLWAQSRGHQPGNGYTSVSGRHFSEPEQATIVAGYEAMILYEIEKAEAAEVA